MKIAELVKKFGMKESKLTKGFKQLFGTSIYNYFLKSSMQHARIMLVQGVPTKVVAITLGYSKTSSFSRAFQKVHGILPGSISMR
ncbi:AraC family transcriptional regulator [Chitinophaga sp.]|uniref:helix-turn-helix domain-containing protein n=1 Tax=Chitinophaga sp. TaxID=1869181 RepID=UPI00263823D8|nr:AraC family transcriptional regulator [uncultured Chitinophaga sp.]